MEAGSIGLQQRETLFELCTALQEYLRPEIDASKLPAMKVSLHRALAKMERDWPLDLQVRSYLSVHTLTISNENLRFYSARISTPNNTIPNILWFEFNFRSKINYLGALKKILDAYSTLHDLCFFMSPHILNETYITFTCHHMIKSMSFYVSWT